MSISRPIGYGALTFLTLAAVWWSNAGPAKASGTPVRRLVAKKTAQVSWDFPDSLTATKFEKPTTPLRNVFKPLFVVDRNTPKPDQAALMVVPPKLAQGESNWAYTGMVEVDGVRMALLENSASHQAGYVREGETWKKSRVVSISTASIVFAGEDASEQTVFRFNANPQPKPKALPEAGFRPMDLGPALKGVIGPHIEITADKPPMKQPQSSPPSLVEK